MKTALLPATRVTPAVRKRVEALLEEGETVSAFIEAAVLLHLEARTAQREFLARGLRAEAEGDWVAPETAFRVVKRAAARPRRRASS